MRLARTVSGLIMAAVLLLSFGGQTFAADLDPFFQKGKLRALILTGRNNHDWRQSAPFLRQILEATGRFDVRVSEEPRGLTPEMLAPYDLAIVDYAGPRWGPGPEKALAGFVRGGKGLVAVHGATYSFSEMPVLGDGHVDTGLREEPWKEYIEMVGGTWVMGPPKSAHGKRYSFQVKFTDSKHPISQGMGESFWATDELYHRLKLQPGIQVLATAFDRPEMDGSGREEPILWTNQYGSGRTFYTALGHNLAAMQEPGFIATFARGAEWAATGKVTLTSSLNPYVRPDATRVELVTGGHDFDGAFGGVLAGYDDIRVWVNPHPGAFQQDFRKRADVLVLYDMQSGLSEKQKQNLQAFVEAGKGVVVLHHALVSNQDWPFWSEEVVGGKYLYKPEGGKPASTYKHDVEIAIRPVGQHPVTAGIGPMRFMDETYKGMWISPEVKVILETDEPTADGPLAWISPYKQSRVVVIQPGHGPEAHRNAAYRQLVRNAVLWAAGKSK